MTREPAGLGPAVPKEDRARGVYREISEDRVVQTEKFDDYPEEAQVTTTWTEVGGKTTLHIVVAFDSQATRDIVLGTGMADGAGESYDALEGVLASPER
ncbi:MAG TPA: SRPBCC domain-containing protein [Kofleriaceae bacterium]|nr:SRPBCC domain-containing protein [Kofleriaceae bacterium]